MTVYRARLKKDALRELPAEERRLFLSLGHVVNEVNGLRKLLIWSSDFSSDNEVIVQGKIAFSLMSVRLLAGKTNEAFELIRKHFLKSKIVSQSYLPVLSAKGNEALSKLKSCFGGSNRIASIRNEFAFHYSPSAIDAALKDLPDELDIYIEDRGQANTLYYCSEVLAGKALLKSLGADDDPTAFQRLIGETVAAADSIHDFAEAFMEAFLERHKKRVWDGFAKPVDLGELPDFSSMSLTWFTDITACSRLMKRSRIGEPWRRITPSMQRTLELALICSLISPRH